jgi:hypothetical protein
MYTFSFVSSVMQYEIGRGLGDGEVSSFGRGHHNNSPLASDKHPACKKVEERIPRVQ